MSKLTSIGTKDYTAIAAQAADASSKQR
eukprot:COSAG06_NODE_43657_length_370_cov_0.571956_1_plen_27_part_10